MVWGQYETSAMLAGGEIWFKMCLVHSGYIQKFMGMWTNKNNEYNQF